MQPLPAAKASQPERTAHPPSRQVCQFARRAVSVEPAPAPPRAWTARVEPNEPGRHLAESLAILAPAVHGSATPTCQAHGEDRALICSRGHEHATVPVHTQKQPSGRCFGRLLEVRAPTLSTSHHDQIGAAPGTHELRRAMSRSPRRAQKLNAPLTGSLDRIR